MSRRALMLIAMWLFVVPCVASAEESVVVPAEIANPSNARELALLRKFYDETIWKDERLAGEYERWIVRLWDMFIHRPDKWNVITRAPVDEMIIGQPTSSGELDWGIATTRFTAPRRLSSSQWRQVAAHLQQAGYKILETEWHHSQFIPPSAGQPAKSVVSMVLHVTDSTKATRYVLRGDLKITWSAKQSGNSNLFTPALIDTTDIQILQRSGTPAFNEESVMEYVLDGSGQSGNMSIHPVMLHDLNGDYLPEVVVAGQNKVYWNRGNWNFEEDILCDFPAKHVNAGALADFTGDGITDFLCAVKLGFPKLYVGQAGEGRFTGPPKELRIAAKRLTIPVSVTAGDIDHDGDLDLFIGQNKTGYQTGEIPSPYYDANDSYPSYLLRNDGRGNFRDVTAISGLGSKRNRRNFASSFVDLNGDGHLDLLLTNDFCGNDLYLNDGTGIFADASQQLVPRSISHGMSHTFGDFNLDGELDFFTIGMSSTTARRLDKLQLGRPDLPEHNRQRKHMGYGNRMYLREADGFRQAPFNDTVARTGWSWGSTTLDFDRDGDADVYVANGQTSGKTTQDYCTQYWCHDLYQGTREELMPAVREFFTKLAPIFDGNHMSWNGYEHNALLMNLGGERFVNVGFLMNCGSEFDSRTAVSGDLDLDGKVDLVFEHISVRDGKSYLHLLKNQWQDDHHWIGFHLDADQPNVSVMGAKIVIKAGGRTQTQQLSTGHSVWAQHPNTVHFGLGDADFVESVTVTWPDGHMTNISDPRLDSYHVVQPSKQ